MGTTDVICNSGFVIWIYRLDVVSVSSGRPILDFESLHKTPISSNTGSEKTNPIPERCSSARMCTFSKLHAVDMFEANSSIQCAIARKT